MRILVVTTGGTIGSGIGDGSRWLSAADLLPGVPGDSDELELLDLMALPSSQIGPVEMAAISRAIAERTRSGEFGGCIVTHGTDTMEETAVWLDLFHKLELPLVVTGAMRSAREPGPDGAANLAAALATCRDLAARRRGVLVVMNEEIHAARYVSKQHSKDAAAFQSPGAGPLGAAFAGQVRFWGPPPLSRKTLPLPREVSALPRVGLLRATAGDDGSLVNAAAATGCDALVIEAMGMGNLPEPVSMAVAGVAEAGLPVAITTRCGAGPVSLPRRLRNLPVMLAGEGYNGPKARIAVIASLLAKASSEETQAVLA